MVICIRKLLSPSYGNSTIPRQALSCKASCVSRDHMQVYMAIFIKVLQERVVELVRCEGPLQPLGGALYVHM